MVFSPKQLMTSKTPKSSSSSNMSAKLMFLDQDAIAVASGITHADHCCEEWLLIFNMMGNNQRNNSNNNIICVDINDGHAVSYPVYDIYI
jgi:hypothetical protein